VPCPPALQREEVAVVVRGVHVVGLRGVPAREPVRVVRRGGRGDARVDHADRHALALVRLAGLGQRVGRPGPVTGAAVHVAAVPDEEVVGLDQRGALTRPGLGVAQQPHDPRNVVGIVGEIHPFQTEESLAQFVAETVFAEFGDYPLEVFGGDQQLPRPEQELTARLGVQPNAFILGDELVKCFQVKLGAVRRF
jgi:hypothetical protein